MEVSDKRWRKANFFPLSRGANGLLLEAAAAGRLCFNHVVIMVRGFRGESYHEKVQLSTLAACFKL